MFYNFFIQVHEKCIFNHFKIFKQKFVGVVNKGDFVQ